MNRRGFFARVFGAVAALFVSRRLSTADVLPGAPTPDGYIVHWTHNAAATAHHKVASDFWKAGLANPPDRGRRDWPLWASGFLTNWSGAKQFAILPGARLRLWDEGPEPNPPLIPDLIPATEWKPGRDGWIESEPSDYVRTERGWKRRTNV